MLWVKDHDVRKIGAHVEDAPPTACFLTSAHKLVLQVVPASRAAL